MWALAKRIRSGKGASAGSAREGADGGADERRVNSSAKLLSGRAGHARASCGRIGPAATAVPTDGNGAGAATRPTAGPRWRARPPHPGYPDIPLSELKEWRYNNPIDLDYPGLQCIYRASASGAPVFVVPGFLSDDKCDACIRKCEAAPRTLSKTTRGVVRTSSHVRVAREETLTVHARVAELCKRSTDSMESAKIIRYQKGHFFGKHSDITSANVLDGLVTLDGRDPPPHCNREITCFIYLNDVAVGGETAFYSEAVHINDAGTEVVRPGREAADDLSREVLRIKPERGLLVLFFPTAQPPDGVLPPLTVPGNQMMWPFRRDGQEAFVYDDMWHSGCPAVDEKYILTMWSWPPYVNTPAGKCYDGIRREERATDGVIL